MAETGTPIGPKIMRRRVNGSTCWLNSGLLADKGIGDDAEFLGHMLESPAIEETLKDDRRSRVQLITHGNRRWILKTYRSHPFKTWWYHVLRRTPAWREWTYAGKLRRAGFRVNVPMALVHRRGWHRETQSLILPYVEGQILHHWIRRTPPLETQTPQQRRTRLHIAEAVGLQIGHMAVAGFTNRDHKPSNLVIDERCAEHGDTPVIIDTARIKTRCSDYNVFRVVAMLMMVARRAGPVTLREHLRCLRGVLQAHPELAGSRPHRLRFATEAVQAIYDAHLRRVDRPDPYADVEPWSNRSHHTP